MKWISAVEGNRSEDPVASHRLDDVEADVGEDPLHVVVDRLPVLLDVPVPRLVHQAAWKFISSDEYAMHIMHHMYVRVLTSVGPVDMMFDPSIWDAPLVGVRVKTLNNSLEKVSLASNIYGNI